MFEANFSVLIYLFFRLGNIFGSALCNRSSMPSLLKVFQFCLRRACCKQDENRCEASFSAWIKNGFWLCYRSSSSFFLQVFLFVFVGRAVNRFAIS